MFCLRQNQKPKPLIRSKIKKWFLLTGIIAACLFGTAVSAEEITFADGEIVVNLTAVADGVVTMHAIWDVADVPLQTPTKPGYTFGGWYSDMNCTEDSFIGNAKDPYLPTDSTVILFAKWLPNTYNVTFDLNDAYTETSAYALHDASCSIASKEVTFDAPYGELPVPTRSGYDFLGWYTKPSDGGAANTGTEITSETRYTLLNSEGTDGSNQTLYARWKNNNPINVKMKAVARDSSAGTVTYTVTPDSNITTSWINVPVNIYMQGTDVGDGISSTKVDVLSSNSDSDNPVGTFGAVQSHTEEIVNADFGLYKTEGTSVLKGTITDIENLQTNRIETGTVLTEEMTLKIDTTKPLINKFDILVGTNKNPLNTMSSQNYIGREVYNSLAYGSKIEISVTDENDTLSNSTDVSNIKYMYLRIYDTDNYDATSEETLAKSVYRDYELITDNYNELTASYHGIIDTNVDFNNVLNLSYELHVTDMAGNEEIVTKTYNRIPEIFAKIERITDDPALVNGEFLAGYRGRLHIFTAGWVDEVSLEWPDCIVKSALYDKEHDEEYMEYNVTINMCDRTDSNLFYLDADGENTEFIRCYTFDFWIPLYIMHENNPDRLIIPSGGCATLPVISVATKYIYNNVTGASSVVSVTSEPITALFTIGYGSILDNIRTSILN